VNLHTFAEMRGSDFKSVARTQSTSSLGSLFAYLPACLIAKICSSMHPYIKCNTEAGAHRSLRRVIPGH
jgi:hypothetical protein